MGIAARTAVPGLTPLLADADPRVRYEAARALDTLGYAAKPALPMLIAALRDPAPEVRRRAAVAIGQIGAEAREAIPELQKRVETADDGDAASAAFTALGQIGPAAAPALEQLLGSKSAMHRELAARALGSIGPDAVSAVGALGSLLEKDPEPAVRSAAVEALAAIAPPSRGLTERLAAGLQDREARVRLASALALGRLGRTAEPASSALHGLLRDPDLAVRTNAAGAIGTIDGANDETTGVLVEGAKGSDPAVRLAAIDQLGRLRVQRPDALAVLAASVIDVDFGIRSASIAALGRIGTPARGAALQSLHQVLRDPRWEMRLMAARALWRVEGNVAELLPGLMGALQERDWAVRDGAAVLLGEMGRAAGPAAGAVRELLKDPMVYARMDGALALWRIEGNASESLPVLKGIVRRREYADPYPRQLAITALGEMGPAGREAVGVLSEASQDEFPMVRGAARAALARVQRRP